MKQVNKPQFLLYCPDSSEKPPLVIGLYLPSYLCSGWSQAFQIWFADWSWWV